MLIEGKEPLDFTRTYASSLRKRDDFGLGNGWTHTYSYFADILSSDVRVFFPEGGVVEFALDYDGSYTASDGNEYSLHKNGDGFLLSSTGGKQVWFNGDGTASKVSYPDGTVINIENSAGKPSKVTTKTGSLYFSYSGGHLVSVKDDSGREVTYEYSGSDLSRVINPDGDSMTYTYDENHNMLTATNLNGALVLENTYDDYYRVSTQKMPGRIYHERLLRLSWQCFCSMAHFP